MSARATGTRLEVIGYGEDALTFHAIKQHLPGILSQLGDPTPVSAVRRCHYRPSYGRGVLPGEPDLVLYTPNAAYFVEVKWERSKEFKKGPRRLVLNQAQAERHTRVEALCQHGVPGIEDRSRLAHHLRRTIDELQQSGNRIIPVALFMTHDPRIAPTAVAPSTFRLVVIHCTHMHPGGYITL